MATSTESTTAPGETMPGEVHMQRGRLVRRGMLRCLLGGRRRDSGGREDRPITSLFLLVAAGTVPFLVAHTLSPAEATCGLETTVRDWYASADDSLLLRLGVRLHASITVVHNDQLCAVASRKAAARIAVGPAGVRFPRAAAVSVVLIDSVLVAEFSGTDNLRAYVTLDLNTLRVLGTHEESLAHETSPVWPMHLLPVPTFCGKQRTLRTYVSYAPRMVAGWDAIDLTDSDSMALIEDPRECIDVGQIALEHVIAHGQVDTFLFAGANLMNVVGSLKSVTFFL